MHWIGIPKSKVLRALCLEFANHLECGLKDFIRRNILQTIAFFSDTGSLTVFRAGATPKLMFNNNGHGMKRKTAKLTRRRA